MSAPRHFLDLSELPTETVAGILEDSRRRKRDGAGAVRSKPLEGRTLAMIFEKPSTRTRVSFDVAMRQLGGDTVVLSGTEMQLGRGETIADTARVLSRYVDAIMIRTLDHDALRELAEHATVPVINGLTRASHPVPGDGRPADAGGASRAAPRKKGRVDGRFQQCAHVLGARRVAFRLPPGRGFPAGAAASDALKEWAALHGADVRFLVDPEKRWRTPTAS
jgi:ornithine carbamoyltransferase